MDGEAPRPRQALARTDTNVYDAVTHEELPEKMRALVDKLRAASGQVAA